MKVCDRSRVKDMKLTFIGYICFQLQRANFRSNGWLLSQLILGDLPQPVMSGCSVRKNKMNSDILLLGHCILCV